MKVLFQWGVMLGILGGSLFGLPMMIQPVLALTEQEVVDLLQSVPVFVLTDAEGLPLIANSQPGTGQLPTVSVFISWQDAQTFAEEVRRTNTELPIQVTPVSLAEIYRLAVDSQQETTFTFVPVAQQVSSAIAVLEQNGQSDSDFQGVPLFIARRTGLDGEFLTIQRGEEEEVIPIFFYQEELLSLLEQLREANPELAAQITTQVITLENLIDTLRSSDDPELNQITLIPPQESTEFVRSFVAQDSQSTDSTQELLQNIEDLLESIEKPFKKR